MLDLKTKQVRLLDLKEGHDLYDPMKDIVFKTIFKVDKNRIILSTILKEFYNITIESFEELDTCYKMKCKNTKGESCDYIVRVNDKVITIECNKKYSLALFNRNVSHLRRTIIDNGFDIVQINFDNYDIEKRNKPYYKFSLSDENNDKLYENLINIYHINLSYFRELRYNNVNELDKFSKVCKLFTIQDEEELDTLCEGDEELMIIKGDIKSIREHEEKFGDYTKDQILSYEEGEENEKHEIAKKMLAKGMNIETISELTDLTKEEIDNLK